MIISYNVISMTVLQLSNLFIITEDNIMFILNALTHIIYEGNSIPVNNAISILKRDMNNVLNDCSDCISGANSFTSIMLQPNTVSQNSTKLSLEEYLISITPSCITISAGDDLGYIYALLYISEKYLGVKPFWFFMDQQFFKKDFIAISDNTIRSAKKAVRFRGWFYNDEVLMLKWKMNTNSNEGYKMAFEALLRCGGNITIPGTDTNSHLLRRIASDMGLYITHHHAEPLGSKMFVREYPDLTPNFFEHKDKFLKLWEDAVIEQKDEKVIWNLCFRGQGDAPFWCYDTSGRYDTDQKRGRLISDVIRLQMDIVKKYVKNPIFCTNLYGEVMELYKQGYIDIDPDVIKVCADNGYGKMVTRRRDELCLRVSSMPDASIKPPKGIYYHVSFYDLQAANHITMLPNSVEFVNRELHDVINNGGNDFFIINCSNVRPHVYFLDAIRKIWDGRDIDDKAHSVEFCNTYYAPALSKETALLYQEYTNSMIPYGKSEDEHAGEQFYTENIRILCNQFIKNRNETAKTLTWLTGNVPFNQQTDYIMTLCEEHIIPLSNLFSHCLKISNQYNDTLFNATIFLQTKIHYYCALGAIMFAKGNSYFNDSNYEYSFVAFGRSAKYFELARKSMLECEYGVWENFYHNDCLADIAHTAYMVKKVMGIVREYGDNVRHDAWQRKYTYSKGDSLVFLQLLISNHMTDDEIFEIMNNKIILPDNQSVDIFNIL